MFNIIIILLSIGASLKKKKKISIKKMKNFVYRDAHLSDSSTKISCFSLYRSPASLINLVLDLLFKFKHPSGIYFQKNNNFFFLI